MKKWIGQVNKVKFRDMQPIDGVIVDYDADWMLMRSVIDYRIDGYVIFNRKGIKDFSRTEREKWTEKVLKQKYGRLPKAPKVPLKNLESILTFLTKKYGVFTLRSKDPDVCWLGRLKSIDSKKMFIEDFTTRAKWNGEFQFKVSEIRAIEFDNDYINSLKMMMKK